jgi:hypothetical protein
VDELIDGLSAEAGEAVRPLLRQAYERGFREALAGAGQPVAAAPPAPMEQPAPPTPAPVATPVPSRVEWVARPMGGAGGAPDVQGGDGDEGEDDDAGETPVPRPILANAKVGTLRRRIIRTFDLERFEIDVVICRSGDPDRRQLRSSARLGLYRREEE